MAPGCPAAQENALKLLPTKAQGLGTGERTISSLGAWGWGWTEGLTAGHGGASCLGRSGRRICATPGTCRMGSLFPRLSWLSFLSLLWNLG